MKVVTSQKTVFCTPDPTDGSRYVELLTLEGVALNIDSGGLAAVTTTDLEIDGVHYLPLGSTIQIKRTGATVAITATVAVVAK